MTGIERLQGMSAAFRGYTWGASLSEALGDIADQIKREHAEDCFRMGERAADVSMSAYDLLPEEECEAVAWVKEHGGIEHVRQQWGYLRGRANHADHVDRQLAKRQRQIDESHAALRRKSERIGFLVSELNRANHENHEMFMRRAGDYTAFADEVCKRLAPELRHVEGCSKDVMDAALNALDRRLMPEGYEWPRFEDGEPVLEEDEFVDEYGEATTACSFIFGGHDVTICDPLNKEVEISQGERVKHPAPKVLDADGVEVRVGDTVYEVNGLGTPLPVASVSGGCVTVGGVAVCDYRPDQLTHRAPVIAADGRPLREGETVYRTDSPTAFVVDDIMTREDGATVVHLKDGAWNRPQDLTHERPDSWERLEEDMANASCPDVYCANHNIDASDASYEWAMARDIVRRAKALAGDA